MKIPMTMAAASLVLTYQVAAHTLLIKPNKLDKSQIEIMMTEKYFKGDRVLDSNTITTQFIDAQGVQWVTKQLNQNNKDKILKFSLLENQQNGMVITKALPRYRGKKKGELAITQENTLRIDDFAKTIIGDTQNIHLISGQLLDIIPERHPITLSLQDNLKLTILYKGEPLLSGKIKIIKPDGTSQYATTNANGNTTIKINQTGLWLFKTTYKSNIGEDQFSSAYEAATSLMFEVE